MTGAFDRRIARAEELAAKHSESAELLAFYREILIFQKPIFAELRSSDVRTLAAYLPALIGLVERIGPDRLASFARDRLWDQDAYAELLAGYWEGTARSNADPESRFFARALLQPFAESLASRGQKDCSTATATCPFCGSHPGAGVLRGEGDGAKRSLICELCATEWPFRRILCPSCGEEHKDKLPVYVAQEMDHIRVETCDTCLTYLKAIDLTKNGLAVPQVDEMASVALDFWAAEHGYSKLQPNLLGM
jgi:FdhE protein